MKKLALASLTLFALTACDSGDKKDADTKKPEVAEADAKKADEKKADEKKADEKKADDKDPAQALAAAEIGKPAPDFALPDLDGKEVKLSDHKGKTVVLEWFNPECPFVKFAHGEGPLKTMAKEQTDKGIVWIAINSGAPGKQGHGPEKNKEGASTFGMEHPILLDESGETGKAYGAKTTPHLFIVDPEGNLVFRGGVDNAPMGKPEGDLENYVTTALEELAAGKPVTNADVRSYGCSVKYAS
jgi:peroxiredoxin